MKNPNIVVQALWGPMIINENDINIGQNIQTTGAWDKNDIDLISKFCASILQEKPSMVLYDVGGNIGSHAIPIAKQYGDKIFVRSFEAQRKMFYMLCGNIVLNDLDNVVCENVAVSNTVGNILKIETPDYHVENNFGGFELVEALNSDNQSMIKSGEEFVQTVTLDSYNEAVDFIKMDIEGMEHIALTGAMRILRDNRPVCLVEMRKTDKEKVIEIFNFFNYDSQQHTEYDWLFLPKEKLK